MPFSPVRLPCRRTCANLAFAIFLPFAAHADAGDVLNYSFSRSLNYDDNLFRLANETNTEAAIGRGERSDFFTQDSLSIYFDKAYGLQRFKYSVNANAIRYRRNTQLDSDPLNRDAAWLWRSGNRLEGELTNSHKVTQSGFSDFRQPIKSLSSTDISTASLNYWLHADLYVGLRGEKTHVAYSTTAQQESINETTVHEWSLRFKPASGNTIAFRQRQTEGVYPNQQVTLAGAVDNSYTQTESQVEVNWIASGASTIGGFLGRTQRKNKLVSDNDYSGHTGRLNWDWQITGKTSMRTQISRDVSGSSDILPGFSLTDILTVGPVWAPTSKTQLALNYQATRRSFGFDSAASLLGLPKREDRTHLTSLSASYKPAQQWSLSLTVNKEKRDSNYAGYSYEAKSLMGMAQFSF